MIAPVTAFLPCRKGSNRVPRKNIRPFGAFDHGLVEVKLGQLLACQTIDRVVLSTNDEEILEFACHISEPRLTVHRRAEHLATSLTSTDLLVAHASDLITTGHILWTHVTSPFVSSAVYDEVVKAYFISLNEGYDSLMSTTIIRTFLWNEQGPINYDRLIEKWPRTQTLKPIHEVNSAVFIAPVEAYTSRQDRIGVRPRLFPLPKLIGLDIDWEEDFVVAEQLLQQGLASI